MTSLPPQLSSIFDYFGRREGRYGRERTRKNKNEINSLEVCERKSWPSNLGGL